MQLVETRLAARSQLGRGRDRRAGGGRGGAPVPGGPVGAADHRALPGGPPGRRAGGLPARAGAAGRRARARSRARGCSSSRHRSSGTTRRSALPRGTCRRCRPSWSGARPRSPRSPGCWRSNGWSRSSGRAGSGRRRSRSRPARTLPGARLAGAAGGRDDRGRRPRHADRRARRDRRRAGADRAAQGRRRGGDPRQLRARRRRGGGARGPPARRRARRCGILCTSQVPLDVEGEHVFELTPLALADAVELFSAARRPRRIGRRGARPVPLARRAAAGDRARRGAHQDALDRGDHAPPRRSLQRAERPGQPPARAPPRPARDDRLELRAAVPRRPAGPVGAGHVRRRRAAAGGRVRARGARRARVGRDRRRRAARRAAHS